MTKIVISPETNLFIDENKCIGCGACQGIAPDYFEIDPGTFKVKIKKQPEAKPPQEVKDAIANCPVQAISTGYKFRT